MKTDVEGALFTEDGAFYPLGRAEATSFLGSVLSLRWDPIPIGSQGWTRAILMRVGGKITGSFIQRQELFAGCLFTGMADITVDGFVTNLPIEDGDPLLLSGKQW